MSTDQRPVFDDGELGWILLALAVLALVAWLPPAAVTWVYDGHAPRLIPAIKGTMTILSHEAFANPASAYPPALRAHMPAGPVWWWPAGLALTTAGLWAWAIYRLVDQRRAQPTLGRRPGQLHGSGQRVFALPRDLRELRVRRARPDRFSLGKFGGRQIASDPEAHVAVIAPTRAGKTTRFVIPWLLEHNGPAIVTSTKTDVLHATRAWRETLGKVLVFDPFGDGNASWDALAGCTDWSTALSRAEWFADAVEHDQHGGSEGAKFWRGEAARVLAPMLHAAAYDERPISDVIAWADFYSDAPEPRDVIKLLEHAGATAAIRQLMGIQKLDPRNRGSAYQTAGSVLKAYRHPALQRPTPETFTAPSLLDGRADTLYIVAPSHHQTLLAPTIVALLSSIFDLAAERSNASGPIAPTLRVLLDETANIAPLRELPRYLSQAAGHGVRVATIWQSVAQLQHRYGTAAGDVMANSTAKIYLGGNTDALTNQQLRELLGDEPVPTTSTTRYHDHKRSRSTSQTWRPALTPTAIRQLRPDQAILIEGRHPAAVVRTRPWWKQQTLRRRGGVSRAAAVVKPVV